MNRHWQAAVCNKLSRVRRSPACSDAVDFIILQNLLYGFHFTYSHFVFNAAVLHFARCPELVHWHSILASFSSSLVEAWYLRQKEQPAIHRSVELGAAPVAGPPRTAVVDLHASEQRLGEHGAQKVLRILLQVGQLLAPQKLVILVEEFERRKAEV